MHNKFTIVTPILPAHQAKVARLLKGHTFICPATEDDPFGFARIDTLHFASLSLYDDPEDGWSLVFEHNIDGDIGAHLRKVIKVAEATDGGAFLLSIYRHCKGFENGSLDRLHGYLSRGVVMPAAGFISAVNMTRDQIRLDAAVYEVVDRALGTAGVALAPRAARDAVIAALDSDPTTAKSWDSVEDRGTDLPFPLKVVTALKLLLHGLGFLGLALWNLIPERTARMDEERPDPAFVRSLTFSEDYLPTNHMLSVVHLHTDIGRQLAKRMAFGILQNMVTLVFRKSFLGEINTIHFAHWSFVNRSRRLIFVSNFDGSWRSYLDDFTLKASNGLNLAWGHSMRYPNTWFMALGGASKEPQFIDFARRSMVPTLVWYSAYPSVSATNIHRNRTLRAALRKARNGGDDNSWLELI